LFLANQETKSQQKWKQQLSPQPAQDKEEEIYEEGKVSQPYQ